MAGYDGWGDARNIRRCLEAPKLDIADLVATLVSVGTTVAATVGLALRGADTGWLVLLFAACGSAAHDGVLRFVAARKARRNPDLLQAQAYADKMIVWQDEACAKVDLEFQAKALIARRSQPPKGGSVSN